MEFDKTKAENEASDLVRKISPPPVTAKIVGTIDSQQISKEIAKANLTPIQLKVEVDKASLKQIETDLEKAVKELQSKSPKLDLFGVGRGGLSDATSAIGQQATQVKNAVNEVSKAMQGFSNVDFSVGKNGRRELREQLKNLGVSSKDIDVIVKQLEEGGFRIENARARFAQQVTKGNKKKTSQVSASEHLQSLTVGGTTKDGVSAVRRVTYNTAAQQFVSSTELGMMLNEQGNVVKVTEKIVDAQKQINKLNNELNKLEAEAFNRRQPLKGDAAEDIRQRIDNLRTQVGAGGDLTEVERLVDQAKIDLQSYKSNQRAANKLGNISVFDKMQYEYGNIARRDREAAISKGKLQGLAISTDNLGWSNKLLETGSSIEQMREAMVSSWNAMADSGENATAEQWNIYTEAVEKYRQAMEQALEVERQFSQSEDLFKQADELKKSLSEYGYTDDAAQLESYTSWARSNQDSWLVNSDDLSQLQLYSQAMQALTQSMQQYNNVLTQAKQNTNLHQKEQKQLQTIAKIRNEWSKAMSNSENAQWLSDIEQQLTSAARAGNKVSFDRASKELQVFQSTMRATGQATQTFAEKMKHLVSEFSQWFSVSQMIMSAINAAKMMIATVTEINSSMTELKKVTSETTTGYEEFADKAVRTAKD